MTIINIALLDQRALLAVDMAAVIDGQVIETTKILPLPHIDTVLVARGSYPLALVAYLRTNVTKVAGLDELADVFAGMLDDAWRDLRATLEATFTPLPGKTVADHEMVLVGWSERAGRFLAHPYVQGCRGAGFVAMAPTDSLLLAPWEGDEPAPPQTIAEMVPLMRQQLEIAKRIAPDMCGSRAIFVRLSPGRMAVETHDLAASLCDRQP